MIAPSVRAKIEHWVNEAPESRKVQIEPLSNDAWETKAIENDQVVFEEVDIESDQPVLRRLAAWCEQHSETREHGLAKTTGVLHNQPVQRAAEK